MLNLFWLSGNEISLISVVYCSTVIQLMSNEAFRNTLYTNREMPLAYLEWFFKKSVYLRIVTGKELEMDIEKKIKNKRI